MFAFVMSISGLFKESCFKIKLVSITVQINIEVFTCWRTRFKRIVQPKMKNPFQTTITLFLLWNTKGDILMNVHTVSSVY